MQPKERYIIERKKDKSTSRHKIVKKLGVGGFAVVYQTIEEKTGKEFAIKVVNKRELIKKKMTHKLIQEIKIHSSL